MIKFRVMQSTTTNQRSTKMSVGTCGTCGQDAEANAANEGYSSCCNDRIEYGQEAADTRARIALEDALDAGKTGMPVYATAQGRFYEETKSGLVTGAKGDRVAIRTHAGEDIEVDRWDVEPDQKFAAARKARG